MCPCSKPTMATRIGAPCARALAQFRHVTATKKQTITRTKSRISPPKTPLILRLRGRLTGAAHPDAVLLFEINPVGLRTQAAAPIQDVDQCRRLRDIEIDFAEVGDAQVPTVRLLR